MTATSVAAAGAPSLRVLSLGAGVQSTTLALLAVEGVLPKPDAAIFADTGWEPAAIYAHLDRLEQVLSEAGVPLHRVSCGGSLRDDVLSRHTFATIPAYTVTEHVQQKPLRWHRCDCPWATLQVAAAGDEETIDTLADRVGQTADQIAAAGDAIDAEEGDDYYGQWCRDAAEVLRRSGLTTVPALHEGCFFGRVVTEWHTFVVRKPGMIKRQCTGKYKVEPIERKIRALLGAPVDVVPCRWCDSSGVRVAPWDPAAGVGPCSVCRGTRLRTRVGRVGAGATAEQWIGFSTDEIHRVSAHGFPTWSRPRYPLIDLGMDRAACDQWLRSRGWTSVEKSACVGCPFHGNAHWRRIRDEQPAEWADAVAFDRAFRRDPGLRGERYLHPSLKPLDEAPIDKVSSKEWLSRQTDLLDLIEAGDPDGCSPYGCRSGQSLR